MRSLLLGSLLSELYGILKRFEPKGSSVSKHTLTLDYIIDFDNVTINDKGNNHIRKTLGHTAKTVAADNNSCPLPRQYNILLKKQPSLAAFFLTFFTLPRYFCLTLR